MSELPEQSIDDLNIDEYEKDFFDRPGTQPEGVPLTPMYKFPVSVAYNSSPSAGLAGKLACKPLLICNAIC